MPIMKDITRTLILVASAAAVVACGRDAAYPTEPPPDAAPLLKDVVLSNLPSPYYHFEYDASGRITTVSFASGLATYDVAYDHDRITGLNARAIANGEQLGYFYGPEGEVAAIKEVDGTGTNFTNVILTYNGPYLTGVEHDRRVDGGFIIDRVMTLAYYQDGNVRDITDHRPAIEGYQTESTTIDHFEGYDDRINVDGFSLLHTDFFDRVFVLPAVRLQRGNPSRVTHVGDGINYVVDYAYTFDGAGRPIQKDGTLTYTNSADAGKQFHIQSLFSYY
jgi:hypothetical protein